ncbi:MAG: hypothetical protein LUE29_04315 [Lachnospiraceae bacterium]|nr:hypothetical protein [Lachnospiraceae bacterium]
MNFKEDTLKLYAAPLSKTEDEKCKHAIEAIRDALKNIGYSDNGRSIDVLENDTLSYAIRMEKSYSSEKIHIFVQGSYANNTCVRTESDVDVAVVREDIFDYAFGSPFTQTSPSHREEAVTLKNRTESALEIKFPAQVHRGNKSLKIDGNTYRKKADAVPSILVKYYDRSDKGDYSNYVNGINIYADDGSLTTNFPLIHLSNGRNKNNRTNYYYKRMVRIIKKMRYLMSDCGYSSANEVSSFGLESLLWNIPDEYFMKWHLYGFAFGEIISYLKDNIWRLDYYYEVNGIKKLCPAQSDVVAYKNFIDELQRFFVYDPS